MTKIVNKIYGNAVYIIFLLFVIWLTFTSGFSTSFMNNASEHTYFVRDNFFMHMGITVLIIAGLCFIYTKGYINKLNSKLNGDDTFFTRLKIVLLCLLSAVCILIAVCAQTIPDADCMEIVKSAYELKNGNYARFDASGYMGMYPHQIGIVVFLNIYSVIFGDHNYLAFQILNAVGITIIYKQLSDISAIIGLDRLHQLSVIALGIIFLPMNVFVTFVYGTVLGLACALIGVKYEMLFIRDYSIPKAVISALCIVFSIVLKSNYIIFMLAMIIYAFIEIVNRKKFKIAVLIMFIMLLYWLQGLGLNSYIQGKTGHSVESGLSSWSWIAMGLQDATYKANGWWNGYNRNTYIDSGYDTEKQEAEVKRYIKGRLIFFAKNKKEAINFFGKKLASQWNNPNFQCFNILYPQHSNIEQPGYIQYMKRVNGSNKLTKIFNIIHFLILIGCSLYAIYDKDEKNRDGLLLQMIVIGGFLFHLIWEAKSLYVLPYFVLLFPLSVKGYSDIVQRFCSIDISIKNKTYKGRISLNVLVLIILICFISISESDFIHFAIKLDADTEEYSQYVEFNTTDKLKNGNYTISLFGDEKRMLQIIRKTSDKSADIGLVRGGGTHNIAIETKEDKVRFKFETTQLYLDLYNAEEVDNGFVQAWAGNGSAAQGWAIKKENEHRNVFYILIGNKSALTYNAADDKICIKELTFSDNQKWTIR